MLLIDVSDEEVVRRLGGRRTCAENGHVFHVEFNPPEQEGVCDVDGSALIVRDDDKPEVIRHRLEHYHEKTEPLIDYYDSQSLLRRIDGDASPGRGRRRDPPHCWRRCGSKTRGDLGRRSSVYRMIVTKTPEQVEQMAAAGEILVRCLQMLAAKARPGVTTEELDAGRREVHPLAGRGAGLQGLPRLPGLDLRLAELDGRPRHPRALRAASAATCSRSTSA